MPFLDRVIIGCVERRKAENDGRCDATLWLKVVGDIGGLVGEEVEEMRTISGKEVWQGREVDEELKKEVTFFWDCSWANEKACSSKITSQEINMLPLGLNIYSPCGWDYIQGMCREWTRIVACGGWRSGGWGSTCSQRLWVENMMAFGGRELLREICFSGME